MMIMMVLIITILFIDRLCEGQWAHIFPEGRVNQDEKLLRFKWGLGRLISETHQRIGITPIVLPIYIQGLDKSMPLGKIPFPRFFKDIKISAGDPIYCDSLINDYNLLNNIPNHNQYDIKNNIHEEIPRKEEDKEFSTH